VFRTVFLCLKRPFYFLLAEVVVPMANKQTLELALRLQDVRHLFENPGISPFSEDYQPYHFKTGLDYVIGEWYCQPRLEYLHVTLLLPAEKITPDLETRTLQAIDRYAKAWLVSTRHDKATAQYQGVRTIIMGVIGFFICTAIGLWLDRSDKFLVQVLSQGIQVLGWVLLWLPLDSFFFSVYLSRFRTEDYRELPEMQLTILPQEEYPTQGVLS
jgi:hypothetical protein